MFNKILVANRGEIAVRAFRAARELGCRTVAVFAQEDRNSEHRVKADESYQIGESGHPVAAYLDIDGIIAVAKHCGAEAIYPGYGFLSENPDFRGCLRGCRVGFRRAQCPDDPAGRQQGAGHRARPGGWTAHAAIHLANHRYRPAGA